jgi:uroporphyrinogen decarboxylase
VKEKERVKNCISFQTVDKVPWQINFTSELAGKVSQQLGLKSEYREVLGRNIYRYNPLDDYFGNHLVYLRGRGVNSVVEASPGIWRDEWNVLWDRRIDRDIGTPVNVVLEGMNLDNLQVPDPHDPERYAHFEPLIQANPDRYVLVKLSYSLFERAWSLRGMENLMIDFIENPSFVHELLEKITNFHLALIKNLRRYPVHGVQFGDDWGGQRGPLISPKTWRSFIQPCLKKMYDQVHSQGYAVFIHSCGNIADLLDDLVETGVDVFNPFQPEVMDLEEIISRYAGRLAFYGGLSIQRTLPFGTPEEVREEVRHRLNLAQTYGGLLISPSHDMPPDIPLKNILAVHEELCQGQNVSG